MSVKVTGLDEVLRALEAGLPQVAQKLNADCAADIAKEIADEAKQIMPSRRGRMRAGTAGHREKADGRLVKATVRVTGAFYWRFLEYGDGPDGVEHAMFLKAREKVMGSGKPFEVFTKRLTAALRKWK